MSEQSKYADYKKLVERMTPNSRILHNCTRSFWVGGLICVIGQLISIMGDKLLHLNLLQLPAFTSICLVFLGTTLTGIGVYDRIGRYAGAGSIVPITGFANSVAAPAMEFRSEGMVMGLGARLFSMAGPVLTYGVTASILVGVVYWVIGRWF
ncbi:stage V sporulation protein AC [Eubacteriales bacterium OttesenSCG-928-N13]|nr:stage V sporulation protein AC [Eubacteriales bacterium OttesenSCG-928-N13]